LNAKAAATAPGANGLLLIPYFNGERTPALPFARASLHGITSSNFTAANLSRASMEGPTFGLRYALDVLRRNGVSPAEIRLVGGGARSRLWREIVANVFGYPVICPLSTEAGALGAALQSMWCYRRQQGDNISLGKLTDEFVALDPSSRVEPQALLVDLYSQLYEQYSTLAGFASKSGE
jgi:sugar (pentulose or hexulose) kinase